MEQVTLEKKIAELPESYKGKLEGYVDALLAEAKRNAPEESGKQKRRFGALKGFVKYISDDFDEPLEEFKDYM